MTKECLAPKITWEKLCGLNSFVTQTVGVYMLEEVIFSLYALKLSCSTYVLSVTTQVSVMAKSHLEGKKF